MIQRWLAASALVCAMTVHAHADADGDAELALHDAQQRAASGDPGALDALEALGQARPVTRWTDDAWRTAAQVAERTHDLARARRDLEQVLATTSDELTRRRAQADLDRLTTVTGDANEWAAVASVHDRLAAELRAPGDPRPALNALETLVREHATYPRAAMAMLVIAQTWEREGDPQRALTWARTASDTATTPLDRTRTRAELARMLIRHGELTAAEAAIAGVTDPGLVRELRDKLHTARLRRWLGRGALALIALIGVAAVVALRRAAGSWRQAGRRLRRPPAEVVFFAPIACVLAAIAQTGNPLVARAVIGIAIAGTLVAWFSGALLEARRDRLTRAGTAVHAALAALTVTAMIFVAIDHDRMLDLVVETWRGGPAMR